MRSYDEFVKIAGEKTLNEIYNAAELKMLRNSNKLKALRAARQVKDNSLRDNSYKNDEKIREKYDHKIESSRDADEKFYLMAKKEKAFEKLRKKELLRNVVRNAIADYKEGKLDIAVAGPTPRFDADIKAYKHIKRHDKKKNK